MYLHLQILQCLPEDRPTEKVYHYLQNVSKAATKTNLENIDPYEFEDEEIHDFGNVSCTISKPDIVYEFSPENEQFFEKNISDKYELNRDLYIENKNKILILEDVVLSKPVNCESNTVKKFNLIKIDPYEFENEKIHDLDNVSCTVSKPDTVYDCSLENEQLFEKNVLNKYELNRDSYKENKNKIVILEDIVLSKPVNYESNTVKKFNIDSKETNSQMSNYSNSDTDYLPPTDSSNSSLKESSDDANFLLVNKNTEENNSMYARDITTSTSQVIF